ncbi:hypothetical protein C8F04DRAFT_1124537 [Mycena alexandri]|uniref:Uncharacterized protein n=1 Tax=Mycena alexandri TaxID=1745969 RepID=A0AAD6SFV4_9AGAR|nr:hypothetical protein C8F04DRAFT_1124537 [Mycena alexandri]
MEEWRRGTDEEAPRNQLPPPSPVTSPGMLSPYPPIQPPRNNVHGHPSQESLQSSTGSTVNITIVPPSRPQSIALSGPPDGPASARHLSPNHAHDTPVVPEEEEDDEDDDDDDYDEDEDDENGGPPRGFVPTNLNPLPVFAQGVQSHPPPGFVVQGVMPLPVGSQQMGARPQHHHQQQQQQPLQNRSAPATWTAPPLIGANSMEPVRPPSRQMGGVLGNPNAGADANANPIWAAPPLMGANVMGPPPPRPLSRQGGGPGNPATPGGAWGAAPPLTVEHPRPLSRQQHGGPVNPVGAGAWGAAPPLTVEHPRPLSRQGNPAGGWGAPPALTTEPARPLSRQGHGGPAVGAWGTAPPLTTEPSRPPSRQMGGVLGNPAATTWAAPPVMGANAMGPPQQHGPPGQLAAAPPPGGWSFAGPYTFGTPSTQPPPLGFPAPSASNAPHSPQPTRPQSFTGDAAMGATTPRPIYGPPINPAFGTGYPSQTPGIAAGYPLPASVSNSSPATTVTTSHQRVNAGTTPGFVPRALSRPASRASSGGFTRYNNNQTPNPNSNLGITNPYTSIVEEGEGGGSGSSGSSTSSLGLPRMTSIDRMTANNTAVNASGGYLGGPAIYAAGPVIPVIPPSPANSHQPLRR